MAISPIDDEVFKAMDTTFQEMRFFGRYRDYCFSIWVGCEDRLQEFFTFLNTLNNDLKFTMEIGGNELCFLDVKLGR